ncbi:MAG: methylated-DNA--[protein]-cysteine S-methyltransferase, partial [Nitrospirales bacterium]
GEYKDRGQGVTISYGFHPSPFGQCLVATTPRGICWFRFVRQGNWHEALEDLHHRWKHATLKDDAKNLSPFLDQIFSPIRNYRKSLYLAVKGTNFQIKVWEALIRIPPGGMVSYQHVARHIGMPKASRAVANAVAHNPIQYLIPCHRVIKGMGAFGGYQAGSERKKALLGWEAAQSHADLA